VEGERTSAGYNHGYWRKGVSASKVQYNRNALTMGKKPIPRKIWKIKTIAVAPNAAGLLPVESRMAAMMKHVESPVADIINKGRLPNRSTVYKCEIVRLNCEYTGKTALPREEWMKQTCMWLKWILREWVKDFWRGP